MSRPTLVPPPCRMSVNWWAWAVEIPWLPDLLGTGQAGLTGNPLHEAFGRQIAFLRAVAAGSPPGTSLQLRFITRGAADPGDPRRDDEIRTVLIGRAPNAEVAQLHARLVTATLPLEFPVRTVDTDDVPDVLRGLDTAKLGSFHWAEVRRAIETLDPSFESRADDDLTEPVLVPWSWSPQALLSSLSLVARQPGRCVLAIHAEPATTSPDLVNYLQTEAARFVERLEDDEQNPLVVAGIRAYRRWLRELPRAALHLRVIAASSQPLLPGLATAIGSDLTRTWETGGGRDGLQGTFRVVQPETDRELDAASVLLDDLKSLSWRTPPDPGLAELLFLFDPMEANTAFRIPVSPRGGLPGVSTGRQTTLPMGRDPEASARVDGIEIGRSASAGPFTLTREEINRHVLVAGLPGFGKTTTVQTILHGLAAHDEPVPFLVIDPAKSDYARLVGSLATVGIRVRRIALTPDEVACNPFGVPTGATRLGHLGRILAAFDAAFDLSTTWPAAHVLLGRALYQAYESHEVPTLNDLYRAAGDVVRRANYRRQGDDIRAALLGRLEFLTFGPTGLALTGNAASAIDWEAATSQPTIIELGRFSGPQERSLIFSLLLAGLVSYREANPRPRLAHVTVLEEAHRVLGNTANQGVLLFADAIAELRGFGEGFLVVDQAPTMLHPSVMKLTGSKLAHRLVESDERASVGQAMLLDRLQQEELARLGQGRMIAFTAEASAPTLVDVEPAPALTDDHPEVAASTRLAAGGPEPLWCVNCPRMCTGRRKIDAQRAAFARQDTHLSVEDLVGRAFATAEGESDAAYCLTASSLAVRHPHGGQALTSDLHLAIQSLKVHQDRRKRRHEA